jgi:hypothetical protein
MLVYLAYIYRTSRMIYIILFCQDEKFCTQLPYKIVRTSLPKYPRFSFWIFETKMMIWTRPNYWLRIVLSAQYLIDRHKLLKVSATLLTTVFGSKKSIQKMTSNKKIIERKVVYLVGTRNFDFWIISIQSFMWSLEPNEKWYQGYVGQVVCQFTSFGQKWGSRRQVLPGFSPWTKVRNIGKG